MQNNYLKDVSILIVDDQAFIRSLLRQILHVLGCTKIFDAADGETAWKAALAGRPDLIIVDWYMAPMNGVDFVRKMRRDPASPNQYVPIIMISGYSDRAHIFTARDAGINEFVVKPISAKALFSRINAVIQHPRRFVRVGEFFGPDRRRQEKVVNDERRGIGEVEPKKNVVDMTAVMNQQEINDLMNPDDVDVDGQPIRKTGT